MRVFHLDRVRGWASRKPVYSAIYISKIGVFRGYIVLFGPEKPVCPSFNSKASERVRYYEVNPLNSDEKFTAITRLTQKKN